MTCHLRQIKIVKKKRKWRRLWGLFSVNELKEVGEKRQTCTRKHLEELEASTTNCRQAQENTWMLRVPYFSEALLGHIGEKKPLKSRVGYEYLHTFSVLVPIQTSTSGFHHD